MNKEEKVAKAKQYATIQSLRDGAYRQAGAQQTLESVAQYVLDNAVGFPETVEPAVKDELYDGYRLKFNELKDCQPVEYAVVDGNYLRVSDLELDGKHEVVSIGVNYAYSFSQQEFGKLKDTEPQRHAIIKAIRERCSTYCSNRLGDLKRAAKKILNNGKERERTGNKDFGEFVEAWFKDTAPTRLKSAAGRHDATADKERFTKAAAAFLAVWNPQY